MSALPSTGFRAAKNQVRAWLRRTRRLYVRAFRSYGRDELMAALRAAGICPGDTIMLHSAFEPEHGFRGTSQEAIDAFLETLGPSGNLLMVSLPYRSSSLEYLKKRKVFDVRRTPSAMGLMSEFFRRRPGVLRSLHPTHPVLALGPRAAWFVTGHEGCIYPCGPGSPFEKLLQADAKVVFFNVGFEYLTFFHFLEHQVSAALPFPLYTDRPFEVPVLDQAGERRIVRTYAFSEAAIRRRRFEQLRRWVTDRGLIREVRVGASRVRVAALSQIANTVEEMGRQGVYFYAVHSAARGKGED